MRHRTLLLLACFSVAACGGQTYDGPGTAGSDSGPDSAPGSAASPGTGSGSQSSSPPGSGEEGGPNTGVTGNPGPASGSGAFTVMSDRPVAGSTTGASYHLEASFNPSAGPCSTVSIGACTVNPCYASGTTASQLPDVGAIQFVGAQIAALALQPQGNGTYTSLNLEGQLAWTTSGDAVGVEWAHAPGDASDVNGTGGSMQLASPPYVALSAGSVFGEPTSTLSREQDLTLSWTSDTQPSPLDQVLVDVTLAPTQVVCVFAAAAGTGTIPAAALGFLETGVGSYDVHSKEYASLPVAGAGGGTWNVGFNVDAHARTATGLAYGAITLE